MTPKRDEEKLLFFSLLHYTQGILKHSENSIGLNGTIIYLIIVHCNIECCKIITYCNKECCKMMYSLTIQVLIKYTYGFKRSF